MTGGGADVINVQFPALQAAAAELGAGAGKLTEHMNNLKAALRPLYQSWIESGSTAAGAYEQSQARLDLAIQDIINVINQFSNKVNEAHDLQLALENKNASYFA